LLRYHRHPGLDAGVDDEVLAGHLGHRPDQSADVHVLEIQRDLLLVVRRLHRLLLRRLRPRIGDERGHGEQGSRCERAPSPPSREIAGRGHDGLPWLFLNPQSCSCICSVCSAPSRNTVTVTLLAEDSWASASAALSRPSSWMPLTLVMMSPSRRSDCSNRARFCPANTRKPTMPPPARLTGSPCI